MKLSPAPPMITAGIVATKRNQAMRSSPPTIERRRTERNHGGDVAHEVTPEVADDRDQRPEMERDVEGLVELVVLLEVAPVEEPRHEDQVSRGGDGKELGCALHEPEPERLPVGQRSLYLADTEDGQQQRDGDRRAGRRKDADPAAHRLVSYHYNRRPGGERAPQGLSTAVDNGRAA